MKNYLAHFKHRGLLISIAIALVFLAVSLVINFYAGTYANEKASNAVTDIVLNNIPVFDVDAVFIYGVLVFWIFVAAILIAKPQRIPFTVKSVSVFVIIRSIFITLTHIGPFPIHTPIPELNILDKLTFGGDLFFSGHTGLPYLIALVFWDNRLFRRIFLATSLLFAVVVLMGHLHYSIDVLGAYFITYSIYRICEKLFAKDKRVFVNGPAEVAKKPEKGGQNSPTYAQTRF